jgi:hypothetical protein
MSALLSHALHSASATRALAQLLAQENLSDDATRLAARSTAGLAAPEGIGYKGPVAAAR